MRNDISNDEATEIATDWLEDHNLPAHFHIQRPLLDRSAACWRVPIYINGSNESIQIVGELSIDAKTGKVINHTSVEAMLEKDRSSKSSPDEEVLKTARRFMDKHNKLLKRLAE